jgi:hypothetical protein
VPRNPSGSTPTIVNGTWLSVTAAPMISVRPPNRRCQYEYDNTATACPGASSVSAIRRPAEGVRRSVR